MAGCGALLTRCRTPRVSPTEEKGQLWVYLTVISGMSQVRWKHAEQFIYRYQLPTVESTSF